MVNLDDNLLISTQCLEQEDGTFLQVSITNDESSSILLLDLAIHLHQSICDKTPLDISPYFSLVAFDNKTQPIRIIAKGSYEYEIIISRRDASYTLRNDEKEEALVFYEKHSNKLLLSSFTVQWQLEGEASNNYHFSHHSVPWRYSLPPRNDIEVTIVKCPTSVTLNQVFEITVSILNASEKQKKVSIITVSYDQSPSRVLSSALTTDDLSVTDAPSVDPFVFHECNTQPSVLEPGESVSSILHVYPFQLGRALLRHIYAIEESSSTPIIVDPVDIVVTN